MKLTTLIENHKNLEKAEIEIQMIPGIPQIHFLGLPDQAIKESFLRIKSALKVCEFKFPITHQIIVNIRPSHLKKSSKGLELAVALGILHMTQQKILPESILTSVIYGELSLSGEVIEPDDLIQFKNRCPDQKITSGLQCFNGNEVEFRIPKLSEDILFMTVEKNKLFAARPTTGLDLKYTDDESEILFLFSVKKFHMLLSGPAGAGKSTIAAHTISFCKNKFFYCWPSLVAPHSSVTSAAFLGGGAQLYQGEIEKVQNGILFLDEFLEFDSEIIETLRGPMTGQKLRLSRAGNMREFECNFQVVATTNLCPCGKWKMSDAA
jgi:magnesium chelatase family protein